MSFSNNASIHPSCRCSCVNVQNKCRILCNNWGVGYIIQDKLSGLRLCMSSTVGRHLGKSKKWRIFSEDPLKGRRKCLLCSPSWYQITVQSIRIKPRFQLRSSKFLNVLWFDVTRLSCNFNPHQTRSYIRKYVWFRFIVNGSNNKT